MGRLAGLVDEAGSALPEPVRRLCGVLLDLITVFNERLGALDREVRERARADELARRLMTIRGVGPVTALALSVLAPPPETFKCGRDLAAWIGLTPRQHSSGGVSRLGKTSRMGQRDLRRLLIIGASAVVRWARRPASADRLAPKGSWLAGMLERKAPMLVTVAQILDEGANKTARIAWVLMAKGGVYRAPATAA